MQNNNKTFIPALGADWATRFYDPLVRITTREFAFKRDLIAQANLQNNHKVLDLACGTGTLSIGIKRRFPNVKIFAIDADEKILQKARQKSLERGIEINFQQGFSYKLPFKNDEFDRIFSTLSFHHLNQDGKIKTIKEILRVLKQDGEFHLADYGLPLNKSQRFLSNIIKVIDGNETTLDNLNGKLENLLMSNGFNFVERIDHYKTILGTIRLFRAYK